MKTIGTIIESSSRMPWHTNLREVFSAWAGLETRFDSLVTDLDGAPLPRCLATLSADQLFPG